MILRMERRASMAASLDPVVAELPSRASSSRIRA
jgi:hypothetical protein